MYLVDGAGNVQERSNHPEDELDRQSFPPDPHGRYAQHERESDLPWSAPPRVFPTHKEAKCGRRTVGRLIMHKHPNLVLVDVELLLDYLLSRLSDFVQ